MNGKRVSIKYRDLAEKNKIHIAEKFVFLRNVAEIVDSASIPESLEVRIDAPRLLSCVFSSFYDVERNKDFHGHNEEPNDTKKLAFLIFWISKLRPFRIEKRENTPHKLDKKEFYYFSNLINSIYCLNLFRVITKKNPHNFFDTKLLYELHYGFTSINSLMVIFDRPIQIEN